MTLVVVVPAFAALCWWQVLRATSGNELSWAYVFEWPLFALYAIYMWWKLVHEPMDDAPVRGPAAEPGARRADQSDQGHGVPEPAGQEDEDLAAYNRYLADLHTSGRPKRW